MAVIGKYEIEANREDIVDFGGKVDQMPGQEILALEIIKEFQNKIESKDSEIESLYSDLCDQFKAIYGEHWNSPAFDDLDFENEDNPFWDFIVWNLRTMEDIIQAEGEDVFE